MKTIKTIKKMTVKQKEKLLKKFIESKVNKYDLYDWSFYYTDSPRDSYAHCIPALKRINIENESIRNLSIASLKDLVLHEIAHVIAGVSAMHGAEFRKVCRKIGCRGYMANNYYECFDLRGKFPHEMR